MWPEGPPHLTLKPSTKNKKEKTHTHTKILKNELFSYQSNFALLVGVQHSFFGQLGPKSVHHKNAINIGVSAIFWDKNI